MRYQAVDPLTLRPVAPARDSRVLACVDAVAVGAIVVPVTAASVEARLLSSGVRPVDAHRIAIWR